MDLDKQAFKFGPSDKVFLKLIFTPEIAQSLIDNLNIAMHPKEKDRMGYKGEFYVCMPGQCIDIS